MRGYESVYPAAERHAFGFRIPMRGYERPATAAILGVSMFRIPMRGYESLLLDAADAINPVPNPHEGL